MHVLFLDFDGVLHPVGNAPGQVLPWTGVRNYQARNFMRDEMRPGDGVLFYHSSCPQPGIAGLAEVAGAPEPDETQFDARSPYHDPKSTREQPRWVQIPVRLVRVNDLMVAASGPNTRRTDSRLCSFSMRGLS